MLNELSIRAFMAVTGVIANIKDSLNNDERGQDLLEYALLGGLIAAGIVAVLVLFGDAVTDMITNIGKCIDFDSGTVCNPGF